MNVVWCSRSKKDWLVIVGGGGVWRFQGEELPGITIKYRDFEKGATRFILCIAEDVKVFTGEGSFLEGISKCLGCLIPASWTILVKTLGVQEEAIKCFLHFHFPKEAEELDKLALPQPLVEPGVISWNNAAIRDGQKSWLVLLKDGQLYKFQGEDIPNVLEVRGRALKNFATNRLLGNGYTIYTLKVMATTRVLAGNGPFLEWITTHLELEQIPSTWAAFGRVLGVQEEVARRFLHARFPKEAEGLDTIDPTPKPSTKLLKEKKC